LRLKEKARNFFIKFAYNTVLSKAERKTNSGENRQVAELPRKALVNFGEKPKRKSTFALQLNRCKVTKMSIKKNQPRQKSRGYIYEKSD
jgi:hypothetical protein